MLDTTQRIAAILEEVENCCEYEAQKSEKKPETKKRREPDDVAAGRQSRTGS
jgi:hypothetical protein